VPLLHQRNTLGSAAAGIYGYFDVLPKGRKV
jgi:hypothetical protein